MVKKISFEKFAKPKLRLRRCDFLWLGINLIYPARCPICNNLIDKGDRNFLCLSCSKQIFVNSPPYCSICGKHIDSFESKCKDCFNLSLKNYKIWYDKIFCVFLYKRNIKKLIYLIKYGKKISLAHYLGSIFASKLINNSIIKETNYIIPVPLHFFRELRRGFNQSQIFAERISKVTNLKILKNVLFRNKPTKPQSNLKREERENNIKESFIIKDSTKLENSKILLIDDIFTTGSTVNECSRILKENGVSHITVATLAR